MKWKDAGKEQPKESGFYLVMYQKRLPDVLYFSEYWHLPQYVKADILEIVLWRRFPYPDSTFYPTSKDPNGENADTSEL